MKKIEIIQRATIILTDWVPMLCLRLISIKTVNARTRGTVTGDKPNSKYCKRFGRV